MKHLDLFSGSGSYAKITLKRGYNVVSVDKYIETDLTIDIADLTKEMILLELGGAPNIITASPVCSAWSKTGWFSHWDAKIYSRAGIFVPKTDFAKESVEMVRKTIEIFSWFPKSVFFMENPEGLLYRHPVLDHFYQYGIHAALRREKVTYCQYGFTMMKPTHIWTNCQSWHPRPHCKNGDACHTASPRGSNGGISGMKDSFIRAVVPRELCTEIINAAEKDLGIVPALSVRI